MAKFDGIVESLNEKFDKILESNPSIAGKVNIKDIYQNDDDGNVLIIGGNSTEEISDDDEPYMDYISGSSDSE